MTTIEHEQQQRRSFAEEWMATVEASAGPGSEANIHQRIIWCQGLVGAVDKQGQAAPRDGGYSYRRIDDVLNALHVPLCKAGLYIQPIEVSAEAVDWTAWSNYNREFRVQMIYRITGLDGDHVDIPVTGIAINNADKGFAAAKSYAYKIMASQLFSLPTDDPEMDVEHTAHDRTPAPPWWQQDGWSSENEHGTRRQAASQRMRDLPPEHMAAAKRWLTEMGVWVPQQRSKATGPGMFAARLSKPLMTEIDLYLDQIELGAQAEAAGEDPFDVTTLTESSGAGPTHFEAFIGAEPVDEPAPTERTAADVLVDVMETFLAAEEAAGRDTRKKGYGTQRNRLLAAVNRAELGSKFKNLDEFLADLPAVALFESKLDGTRPGTSDPTEGTQPGPDPDTTDGPADVESTRNGDTDPDRVYEGDIPEDEELS